MIRNIKRQYFEVWGSEEAQNVILKRLFIGLALVVGVESVTIAVIANRKPIVIAIADQKSEVLVVKSPSEAILRAELERTVKNYALTHYTWDYNSIEKAHKEAAKYISEKFQKAFLKTNDEQVHFVKEKKVTQKVYISGVSKIDPKELTARIRLDRIYTIEGLSGAAPIILDLKFEYGDRTDTNPEGIYITDEKLVGQEGDPR
jgi:hypothetical protein